MHFLFNYCSLHRHISNNVTSALSWILIININSTTRTCVQLIINFSWITLAIGPMHSRQDDGCQLFCIKLLSTIITKLLYLTPPQRRFCDHHLKYRENLSSFDVFNRTTWYSNAIMKHLLSLRDYIYFSRKFRHSMCHSTASMQITTKSQASTAISNCFIQLRITTYNILRGSLVKHSTTSQYKNDYHKLEKSSVI